MLGHGGRRMLGLAMKRGSVSEAAVGEEGVLTGKRFSLRSTTLWTTLCSVACPSMSTSPCTGRGGESRMLGVPSPVQVSHLKAWMVCWKMAPHLASSSSSVKATTESWKREMACARLAVCTVLLWI